MPSLLIDEAASPLWLKIPVWLRWGGAVVANTLIALFLTAFDYGGSLMVNWVFSQCIGLSITGCIEVALRKIHVLGRAVGLTLAVVSGSLLGSCLGLLVTGLYRLEETSSQIFLQAGLIGLVIGTAMTSFAYYRERTLRSEQELDATRLRHLSGEKARVETELRMLQAQVEPHFLFNTLAILRGLIGHDPEASKQLLDHLIDYLRASLSHSRSERATLGDELALLENYLTIMQFRMGARLSFSIVVPDGLRELPLPPMLLQPLVENAIRHGLEPKTGAGNIRIEVLDSDDGLLVTVKDNGVGFIGHEHAGSGLANIQARLDTLFEGRARLTLQDNESGGVTASLSLPHS